jgi:tetratricopeptide (TPR) repeat protein
LRERVRLYLNVCERQVVPRTSAPGTPEERVFAATVAFNAGDYETALEHLREANKAAPDHDLALYMLAAVLALRNEPHEAVPYLLRAIELNPENRAMARHDADLEALRNHAQVRAALEAIPPAKPERRRSPRRSR